jgi:hypothetical protein
MPQKRYSVGELVNRVREQLADVPATVAGYREAVKEDPARLLRSPIVRIGGWIVLGLAVVLVVQWMVSGLTPAAGRGVEAPTPYATVYVACTNPACRAAFTARVERDFRDWPLSCEKCGQKSAYRAGRCATCRSWFATAPGQLPTCPECDRRKAADAPKQATTQESGDRDDAEDPW